MNEETEKMATESEADAIGKAMQDHEEKIMNNYDLDHEQKLEQMVAAATTRRLAMVALASYGKKLEETLVALGMERNDRGDWRAPRLDTSSGKLQQLVLGTLDCATMIGGVSAAGTPDVDVLETIRINLNAIRHELWMIELDARADEDGVVR